MSGTMTNDTTRYVDAGGDGLVIGSSTGKISFFGGTPVGIQDDCTNITLSTTASSYLTDMTAVRIAINQLSDALGNLHVVA